MTELRVLLIKVCRTLPSELKPKYRILKNVVQIKVCISNKILVIPLSYKELYKLYDIDKIVLYIMKRVKYAQWIYNLLDNAIIYYN